MIVSETMNYDIMMNGDKVVAVQGPAVWGMGYHLRRCRYSHVNVLILEGLCLFSCENDDMILCSENEFLCTSDLGFFTSDVTGGRSRGNR